MERRSFLKASAALGAAAAVTGCDSSSSDANVVPPTTVTPSEENVNWSACLVNCGSNCPIKVFSKDGVITRIEADHETDDVYGVSHHIRACPRGRSLRQRTYAMDRLRTPMKQMGKRGDKTTFVPISWEQAYAEIAEKLQPLAPESIYLHYGTGAYYGFSSNTSTWGRLLNLTKGGYLNYHWDYSWAAIYGAAIATYGEQGASWSGSFLSEIQYSDLFVGFGFNPNEIRMSGSGEGYDFVKALENNQKNIKVWMIDPRYTDSMRGNEDEWLAVRPGTDAALIEAVIYQMISSGWVDAKVKSYLDQYVVGYDRASLENAKAAVALDADPFKASHAQYIDPDQNYHDYIMGEGVFTGAAKTPEWAAKICGISEAKIKQLADAIMAAETPYISAGSGINRHANGDQATRAVYTLAIMTGKVGLQGVNSGAMPGTSAFSVAGLPAGENKVDITIPVFKWSEAIKRGSEFTGTADGVRFIASGDRDNEVDHNEAKLTSNIKAIINCAGNALVNQHSEVHNSIEVLQDPNLELIVVSDCWMTPSAEYADYLLPDTTWLESEDYADNSYASGDMTYATFMSTSLTPLGDSKSMYDICAGIAKAMGQESAYTEGKTTLQWCEELYLETKAMHPDVDMPATYQEAQKQGLFRKMTTSTDTIAFAAYRSDPIANPVATITGKFEIFSVTNARKAATWTIDEGDQITALPQYVVTWDGYEDQKAIDAGYTLQLCGYHTKGRTHSSYHNVPWLREAVEDAVWMNPKDALSRGLSDGDTVYVYNDRGTIELPVKLTPRVAPGVCALGQGAWYKPEPSGKVGPSGHVIDIGGCLNTLTKYHPSPLAKGNPQHTNRVQVVKA